MSTQVETSKALEVAHRLVDLCREGKNVEAINELYDDNVVSIEPEGSPMPGKTVGKKAVLESTNHWYSSCSGDTQRVHFRSDCNGQLFCMYNGYRCNL